MIAHLLLTLLCSLGANGVPYEYSFIYPPLINASSISSRHSSRTQDTTYSLHDLYEYGDPSKCKRDTRCVSLNGATCFGISLPYDSTSLDFLPASKPAYAAQSLIRQQLRVLQGLKSIPKCWSVVRPFLCSLFMPKCVNGTIERLSQSMCTTVLSSCRLILNETIWPKFIRCDNEDLFLPQCQTINRDLKFNKSWSCPTPLIPTNNTMAVFDGIDGCGIPCHDPLYTQEEHQQIRTFIVWGAASCFFLNFFSVITFLIDWRSANKFPASVIFYISVCFMLCCVGWLIQFSAASSDIIVCGIDGTLRKNEPNGDLVCVVVFILVYYPLMAAIIWFVILTYAWHTTIQPHGKINNRLDKKSAYFHLSAWCLPLMLTVSVMGMSEVSGDSLTGICFISRYNYTMRTGFVLAPVVVAMLIGGYFLTRSLIRLISLTISSEDIITEKASAKLRDTIVRMGLFFAAIISTVIITIYCHVYDFVNYAAWEQSFRDFVICSITTQHIELSSCKIESRPSVTKLQLHLFALFFTGIIMSSWVWTSSSLGIWLRFIKRLFSCDELVEEPVKLKKQEAIVQAYSKRKDLIHDFCENQRFDLTYYNEDPVGLNFDPNSLAASQDYSASWAAALPRLIERRDATIELPAVFRRDSADSRCSNRRSSNDSSYSFSLRRVSITSNESEFAMSIDELTARGHLPKRGKSGPQKHRAVGRKYKVTKSRRTARGAGVGNSQDTPAIDTDY